MTISLSFGRLALKGESLSVIKVTRKFRLGKRKERFTIKVEDRSLEWASRDVSAIVLEGEGLISSGAIKLASEREIRLAVLVDGDIAVLEPLLDRDPSPLLGQVRALANRSVLALRFLSASIKNKMWLLEHVKHMGGGDVEAARARLAELRRDAGDWRKAWEAEGRAMEVVNELLERLGAKAELVEYARMHVVAEATMMLVAEGLEPTIGFLHPDSVQPALSRDLAIELLHQTADFSVLKAPEQSRRSVLTCLEKRMEEEFTHPRLNVKTNYRDVMRRQAKSLAAYFSGKSPGYQPHEEASS